ncbi:hypothetical protein ES707_08804 [subsurface metagenome]
MGADNGDIGMGGDKGVKNIRRDDSLAGIVVPRGLGGVGEEDEPVLLNCGHEWSDNGVIAQVQQLHVGSHLTDASGATLGTALNFGNGGIERLRLHGAETNQSLGVAGN